LTGVLKNARGFRAKANPKRPTIFRVCPEVENGAISPMRLDNDGTLSCFFDKVTIAEMGGAKSGAKFTTFICDPSDAPEDMPRSDYPAVKLKAFMDDALDSNPEWLHPFLSWFAPHGQYNGIGFPWPATHLCLQGFAYQQPGCQVQDAIEKAGSRLANHPQYGYVMNKPADEFKVMFIKGGGIKEMEKMFLGRVSDDSEEFMVPATVLDPGSKIAVHITGGKEDTEDGERTVYLVKPFNLVENNCWVPDAAAIKSNFRPWNTLFKKMTYNEQMQKLVSMFSPDLINRCFGTTINVQAPAPTAGAAPAADAAPAAGGWGAGSPAADAAPAAEAAPAADGGWGGNSQQAPANTAPAAEAAPAAAGGWGGAVADATAQTPKSDGGQLSEEALEDRFNKYKQGDS